MIRQSCDRHGWIAEISSKRKRMEPSIFKVDFLGNPIYWLSIMHKSLLENVAGICVEHHAMPRQFPVSPSLTHPHNICNLPSSVWNCICKKRRVHLQICTNSVAEHLGAQIGILGWNFRLNNLRISKVHHETRNLLQELQTVYHDLQESTTNLSPNLEPWQVR